MELTGNNKIDIESIIKLILDIDILVRESTPKVENSQKFMKDSLTEAYTEVVNFQDFNMAFNLAGYADHLLGSGLRLAQPLEMKNSLENVI